MDLTWTRILESTVFKFVVGSEKKEYSVHEAALSGLSRPLQVLLKGPLKESQQLRVEWPDVEEEAFVRFIQWVYTKDYVTAEPDVVLDQSSIANDIFEGSVEEKPLYSLESIYTIISATEYCHKRDCASYKLGAKQGKARANQGSVVCIICRKEYQSVVCALCASPYTDCPCAESKQHVERTTCWSPGCALFLTSSGGAPRKRSIQCPKCRLTFSTVKCGYCSSAYSNCPRCSVKKGSTGSTRVELRADLIEKFLDKAGEAYTLPTSVYVPRKNTEACEDYSGVFLCHAKLYVLGDTYDIPQLCRLSLHRLHATLKDFTLYPSRFNDISALATYVFQNTRSEDKIQDMITLYYACIIEDASKHEGLKALIDEVPDFARGLIARMSERLA